MLYFPTLTLLAEWSPKDDAWITSDKLCPITAVWIKALSGLLIPVALFKEILRATQDDNTPSVKSRSVELIRTQAVGYLTPVLQKLFRRWFALDQNYPLYLVTAEVLIGSADANHDVCCGHGFHISAQDRTVPKF